MWPRCQPIRVAGQFLYDVETNRETGDVLNSREHDHLRSSRAFGRKLFGVSVVRTNIDSRDMKAVVEVVVEKSPI